MMTSFSFGCEENSEEVDRKWGGSCEERQELCGLVASRGSRHIGSGCSPPGSVPHGSRRDRMILQM